MQPAVVQPPVLPVVQTAVVNPVVADPSVAHPAVVNPVVNTSVVDPTMVEPVVVDSVVVDPVVVDPVVVNPVVVNPVVVNPVVLNPTVVEAAVAHALVRAASALVPTLEAGPKMDPERSHECERGTQECARHQARYQSQNQTQNESRDRDAHPIRHDTPNPRRLHLTDLGHLGYTDALALQKDLVEKRKRGLIPDQLLIVEHPHVITLGRNGRLTNLLASEEVLERAGIAFHPTDRGGDITYHGPGQVVGYPIFDLREWKRDVVAYVRTLEQVVLDALAEFAIKAERVPGCTGVWVDGKKVAAIGVHISRWVTSHGFALNHTTDLTYFQYIVPCGLTKPVTSMQALGCNASREEVVAALVRSFSKQFQFDLLCQERDAAVPEFTETF